MCLDTTSNYIIEQPYNIIAYKWMVENPVSGVLYSPFRAAEYTWNKRFAVNIYGLADINDNVRWAGPAGEGRFVSFDHGIHCFINKERAIHAAMNEIRYHDSYDVPGWRNRSRILVVAGLLERARVTSPECLPYGHDVDTGEKTWHNWGYNSEILGEAFTPTHEIYF